MWCDLLGRGDVLILDTETTGLGATAEIVDLAVIDTAGRIVMDVPVMPKGRIPAPASRVHGLTRRRLAALKAKPWPHHHRALLRAIRGASVVCVYNLEFDMRMLMQTMGRHGLDDRAWQNGVSEVCIMLDYARWRRVPDPWRAGQYRWHKLGQAHRRECGPSKQGHRALADCRMVLELMRAVCNKTQRGHGPRK